MIEGDPQQFDTADPPTRPGERLRDARLEQRLDLGEIAQRTRIPQRHLEAIENGNYAGLPSATYAVGFAKAYARAVDIDEVALAAEVRDEIASSWNRPAAAAASYEVEDPSRLPSRGLVWGGVLVALLLIAGVTLWFGTNVFRDGLRPAAPDPAAAVAGAVVVPIPDPAPAATPTPAGGQVRITATDEVWVRIYDAADTTLMMKTMAPGESYDVPAGTATPKINVGRPDKLAITVGGAAVPALGDGRVAIKDVSLEPAALLARIKSGTAPAPDAAPRADKAPPKLRPSPRAADPATGNASAEASGNLTGAFGGAP